MKERIPIGRIVLAVAGTAGFIALVAVAPGIGPALSLFGFGKKRKPYSARYVREAVTRLEKKGFVVIEEKGGKEYVRLTEKGKSKLETYEGKNRVIDKPKRWDGKWRLVMFDIEEPMRSARTQIRNQLVQAGFYKLQDSVWIHPYDCEEYVGLLKADKRIGKGLLYVVAEKVEYDRPLKEFFDMK